jgi:hypothetical protein
VDTDTLPNELRSQVLGFVLRGAPLDVVLDVLDRRAAGPLGQEQREAVAREYARMFMISHERDDVRRAAGEKALWLLSTYRQLAKQSGRPAMDTVDDIEPERFFEEYYFANRPVKIRGFAARWQDFSSWSVPRLLERFGDAEVEIMSGRDDHDDYDENVDTTRRTVRFRDFVSMLDAVEGSTTNDFYLAARNLSLRRTFKALVEELEPLPGFLTEHEASFLNLWIGPAGTVTKLHHDLSNVLFMQLFGSKRITLVPPFDAQLVYNTEGVIAQVDAEQPDYKRYPLFGGATAVSATVDAGDAIFLPVGWFHQVRSLSQSVSLSFVNFAHANFFAMDDAAHSRGAKTTA